MREHDTKYVPWELRKRIRAIRITSDQLLDFVRQHAGDDVSPTITYQKSKEKSVSLDGLTEIEKHKNQIRLPFTLKTERFSVTFS